MYVQVLGPKLAQSAVEDNPDLLGRFFPDATGTMADLVRVLGEERAVMAVAAAPDLLTIKGSTILHTWDALREVRWRERKRDRVDLVPSRCRARNQRGDRGDTT